MASFQSPSLSASKGFPPLFVKASTLPSPSGGFINGLDICYALENVSGKDTVDCVQRMGDLFRIYTKNLSAREDLLIKGFSFNNISIPLLSHNPFQVKDQVVNTTKLVIGGVPMSVADSEIERALLDLGLNILSELKYETYRDNNGKWTHFKTGRRFVYIELPKLNLDQFLKIGLWKATLYYRQQIRPKKVNKQEDETLRLAETVTTQKTQEATSSNETGVPSAAPATSETNNGNHRPITGKPTYSDCTSISDNDLWNEANGKGVTSAVKIPVKTANDSGNRKGRSPTRHNNRQRNLRDHWNQSASRSSSAKRKVRDSQLPLLNNANLKFRKTDNIAVESVFTESSPSEDSGLC